MCPDEIDFLPLGMDDDERSFYDENKVNINMQIGMIEREAQERAKLDHCYYCNEPSTSFCNSHSVPKFCLRRIAVDGQLFYANTLIDLPYLKEEQGVNKAGTFQLICRKCDGRIFQQYEDPNAYDSLPNGQVLAQIAMKNHLQMIAKRLTERQLYRLLVERNPLVGLWFAKEQQKVIDLDLGEYEYAMCRAKVGARGKRTNYYRMVFYRKLNYTVPIAFQGEITMISDFEKKTINETFNKDNRYRTEPLHIAIFPLERTSVVMSFVDSRCKRYKRFEEQLKQLDSDDQLLAIQFIVMSYSENVFYSKSLKGVFQSNEQLATVSRMNSMVMTDRLHANVQPVANDEFDLSKRNTIPNLLTLQYAI